MNSAKPKMTFYLSEKATEFLKKHRNKTAVINKAIEDLALKETKEVFMNRLNSIKPIKSNKKVIDVLRQARDIE
jgi:hypothetical protein